VKLAALLAAGALALAVGGPGTARVTEDPCLETGETPVQLTASDGASVYGVESGTGTTGVVLGHMYLSDHCEWTDFTHRLVAAGFRVLAIDFRGYGDSRGGAASRLDRDIAAAVARLRKDGATRVELVGASMGGAAVLVAASWIRQAVDGVVSLSGPAAYRGLDALRAVRRSHVPVRFVVGTLDPPFAADAVRLMKAAAARDKAILRLLVGSHGSSLLRQPRASAFVLRFLGR